MHSPEHAEARRKQAEEKTSPRTAAAAAAAAAALFLSSRVIVYSPFILFIPRHLHSFTRPPLLLLPSPFRGDAGFDEYRLACRTRFELSIGNAAGP